MIVSHLQLKNWRNFKEVDVPLRERGFLVGPNASGKSNLLDVFRFLRDIAKPDGGGLQKAVKDRGGVSKLRSLAARHDPEISITIHLANNAEDPPIWQYSIGLKQEPRGHRQPILSFERVWKENRQLLNRPDNDDCRDRDRLKQTFLEQINANAGFREIPRYLESITYLHLVPQLLRYAESFQGRLLEGDPYGQGFLERVSKTQPRTQKSRLAKIEKALRIAVPQMEQLKLERDEATGKPHLSALYSHWRPKAGWQREDQFSDGTLRLIALLWSLLDGDSLLLLEEPELSLNTAIVSQLAPTIYKMQQQGKRKRQILISTHSDSLLNDPGIDGREVLLLTPGKEASSVEVASSIQDIRPLLTEGLSVGEVILPRSKPDNIDQLGLSF